MNVVGYSRIFIGWRGRNYKGYVYVDGYGSWWKNNIRGIKGRFSKSWFLVGWVRDKVFYGSGKVFKMIFDKF